MAEEPLAADDAPRLQHSPAPGFHLFVYRGRLMWMHRDISMNLQVIETVHLGALFASRRLMEELLEAAMRHASLQRANRLTLYTVDRFGDEWRLADSKPRRSLDSVVLDAGVARYLHDDIHGFFRAVSGTPNGHPVAARLPLLRPAGHRQNQCGLCAGR